ncbi:hypothetical protein H5410_036654 [Solanum commersonii]|uniref:Uncharacterized protein n=1 Tax=Solanum commersonii TaxID=4109 RepID=A0A9J5Y8U0_SOLCO|nr:hypothetical protein H5410_036654 [Solanum commersonii]
MISFFVRIYITDNGATESSSDEKENLQGENSKRHKRMCKEILLKNEKTKWNKTVKIGKVGSRNLRWKKECSTLVRSYATTVEVALAYDNTTIEIGGANAWTNILEPPPKEINLIKTIPPLRNDEKENLPGENSKRHKRMCMEILIENEKTKNVRHWFRSYATTEKALAYDNTTIEIRDNGATESSSDEKQNLPSENSKRYKRMCVEILIENEKTKRSKTVNIGKVGSRNLRWKKECSTLVLKLCHYDRSCFG